MKNVTFYGVEHTLTLLTYVRVVRTRQLPVIYTLLQTFIYSVLSSKILTIWFFFRPLVVSAVSFTQS